MEKVFIIQYKDKNNREEEYALSYESAKNHLEKQGFKEEFVLNEEENEAGIFISPETKFFAQAEARIISRKYIV